MMTAVVARSKVWVCSLSLVGIAGSNGSLSLVIVVYCQVEVPALRCSLVKGNPTDYGAFNWMWSWSLDDIEALDHRSLLRHGGKKIDVERNIDYCKCAKFKVDSYMSEDVTRLIGLISLSCASFLVVFRWSAGKECPLVLRSSSQVSLD